MISIKQKENSAFEKMKVKFGYKNKMSAPHLVKVVISVGTGSGVKKDKNRNELVLNRLAKITGQKGSLKLSKKSIAGFKLRQGEPVGVVITLRGSRMYGFLDKLLNVSIPRTKDFRGIENKIVDSIGNATIGIKEHTIFPETSDEELKDVFGMAITLVSTAKNRNEALEFFTLIGVPFKK
ncbi:MAG: 50S ribosomal protein L5 [Candidatus Nomurabacteria bacterium GW2011_GWB1_37_5]|uniref:Large ribosomal subunit protein uL5 n=1 Tax=Candidatus Nomurabacteria bacterium GW2011_GWB1_37_5 TaxID=1618742 RepID=A0A0G0GTF1_9BACT|nr:MAG: 50S ribosomal protein L5 [Candidatus Nomurabacteria bacterium GW2011_GWB1_37_5]